MSIGVGPIHEPQGTIRSKFLKHEGTESLLPPSIFKTRSNHSYIPYIVIGVGPLDSHKDAVIHIGTRLHRDYALPNAIGNLQHIEHAKSEYSISII